MVFAPINTLGDITDGLDGENNSLIDMTPTPQVLTGADARRAHRLLAAQSQS